LHIINCIIIFKANFSLSQMIHLIILCIKVLLDIIRYSYKKVNGLQDILYCRSKCARI